MSEAISAPGGVATDAGIASIRELGPQGMITLRGDLGDASVKKAATDVAAVHMAGRGQANMDGERGICWMSPDEALVLCPYAETGAALAQMQAALGSTHALAVNVSDARALFALSGPHARDVMAKLAPVDFAPDAFVPGQFRRSRLAQVPAAFWMTGDGAFRIICFRSVARYVFDLLTVAAQPGSAVELHGGGERR